MASQKRKKRTKRCWACYCFIEVDDMEQVCMPPLLQQSMSQPSSDSNIYRRVCSWCAEQIARINSRFATLTEWQDYWQRNRHCEGLFRGRPHNRRQHPSYNRQIPPLVCFFCGQPVGQEDPLKRQFNVHHVTPRREFENKADANFPGNLSYAHQTDCHSRFHREIDQPNQHIEPLSQRLADQNLGHNIFAGDAPLVA